jgi:hypothetical protein
VAYDKSRWIQLSLTCAMYRGSFAVVKEGRHKASGTAVAIKIVDKKDAVFDPESLEQEVSCVCLLSLGRLCSAHALACLRSPGAQACPGMLALSGSSSRGRCNILNGMVAATFLTPWMLVADFHHEEGRAPELRAAARGVR